MADSGNDDDEEDEDEYQVEKILNHKFERNKLKYQVKWLGYEDEADWTWEPADNLCGRIHLHCHGTILTCGSETTRKTP